MHPTPAPNSRRWDGTLTRVHRARSLGIAPTSPTHLLRTGQRARCTACGNAVDWFDRTGHPPISLHPHELPTIAVPAPLRWHVSSGIAHPQGDGTPWCRVPHPLLCPGHPNPLGLTKHLAELRRHLALRTRRLIDTSTALRAHNTPGAPTATSAACRPARPVVQILNVRYLAVRPVENICCVAQTRHRHRCTRPVLNPATPGIWILLPAGPLPGQRALTDVLIAVYDLSALPEGEQRRWHTQRCPQHAAAPAAADLVHADWEAFDPLLHHQHIATRIPAAARRPHTWRGQA